VMPELLQTAATPENICTTALNMLDNLEAYRQKLTPVRRLLGSAGASRRAAKIALNLLHQARSDDRINQYLTNNTKAY
jgi:lipid A disaccharide synthetase